MLTTRHVSNLWKRDHLSSPYGTPIVSTYPSPYPEKFPLQKNTEKMIIYKKIKQNHGSNKCRRTISNFL